MAAPRKYAGPEKDPHLKEGPSHQFKHSPGYSSAGERGYPAQFSKQGHLTSGGDRAIQSRANNYMEETMKPATPARRAAIDKKYQSYGKIKH